MIAYSTEARAAMVVEYRKCGSLVRTAEKFDCSPTTVSKYVRRAGITLSSGGRPSPPGTPPSWSRRIAMNGYAVWYGWVPGENRYQVIAEHRLVFEKRLGRPLQRWEQVHHRNGRRADNREDNLDLRVGNHGSGASHCPHCGKAL